MSRFRMNTTYDIPINICLKLAWRIPKRLIHYNHKCRRFIFGVDFVWAMWIRRIESILLTITINMYSTVYNFLFCLTHEVHHNWPSNIRPQWDHIFYHWRRFLPQMTLGYLCTTSTTNHSRTLSEKNGKWVESTVPGSETFVNLSHWSR